MQLFLLAQQAQDAGNPILDGALRGAIFGAVIGAIVGAALWGVKKLTGGKKAS